MKCDRRTMLLYAVTDRAWTGEQSLYEQVEAALKGGATCIQLREKELDAAAFSEEAMQIAPLCRRYGVPLFINDNVDVAIACIANVCHKNSALRGGGRHVRYISQSFSRRNSACPGDWQGRRGHQGNCRLCDGAFRAL
ncbi:MAG: thiamine phosphate synthase [Lachnospiraceae bacterium]|nr:thiamine phosphate synthase [Lachnospiraceae bacterium]